MFQQPCFKAHFQVEVLKPDKVLLFDAKGKKFLLEGKSYALLTPYLKKKLPLDEIIDRLQEKISIEEIYYLLLRLQEQDLIEEQNQEASSLSSLCHLLNVSLQEAKNRLQNTRISVSAVGRVQVNLLKRQLQKVSLQVGSDKDATLKIVAADHYRHAKLDEINQQCLEEKIPWLLTKVKGGEVWIGPLFIPEKTGCYECLKSRLSMNDFEEIFVENQNKCSIVPPNFLLPSAEIAANLTTNEILKWVVQGQNEQIEGKVLSFDLFTSHLSSHSLMKRPQCPACGNFEMLPLPQPIRLQSQKERSFEDGHRRAFSPEKTYQKYQHLISPITGIISTVQSPDDFKNSCVHVYMGGQSPLSHFRDRSYLKEARSVSGGKGKTSTQAKVSCLCEAIERYSGFFQGNEHRISSTYQALKADCLHPKDLLLFSKNQYATREKWNQNTHSFHYIPVPFDEEKQIEWSPLWSLTEERFKWAPTAFCYYLYPLKDFECFCKGDSNGCASGNTLEEAILQGFFELIERDSTALWWYSRSPRPGIDFHSFNDPYIDQLVTYYSSLQREIWALDLTADFEIPTFAAISRKIDSEKEIILIGLGSHFDPKIALSRALTEMNQSLGIEKTISHRVSSPFLIHWLQTATVKNQPYLLPSPRFASKKYSDYKRFCSEDEKQDVLTCQKLIESKGMEMLILDQTRLDAELPVVRVVVPGLRHFWNRFAPGRLYEIPVQLGWVEKPLKEEDLNPIPVFI